MKKRVIFRILCILVCLGLLGGLAVLGINGIVKGTTKDKILSAEQAAQLTDVDCILVLGCGVRADGSPSDMLYDRLRRGVELYEAGAAPKLLMTGDHGRENYDEVDVKKSFAVDAGIASENVFMDHAGFSTYESMYRAKEIFQAKKVIIVTQQYHLYRAIYIAESLGLEAYGVAADYRSYYGQTKRDIREVLARVKDFGTSLLKPKPTYLGNAIPIWGDGNLTNDENSDFS
jgi:vancomycin permeability regulator SanA